MIANNTCPTDDELRDFVSGRLPNDRFGDLLSHVDSCDACQRRADRSADLDDSFAVALAAKDSGNCPIIAEPDCQAALFHATSAGANRFDSLLPPIETLGPYRLLRPLGRGGMGAVYLAEHERLRKKYAIKLLPRERGFDTDWLSRFEREMQAVASLDHPNIVTATDAGDVDGWHYLVMEYLDGIDLAALSRRLGPIPVDAAAAIGRDISSALAVVHDAGLIHRDVKPSNVMLTRAGTVKLLDLGLVLDDQAPKDEMRLTTVGHVMGTLAFAAPEQLSDETTVDSRADLYGLGATLFQLIAGQGAHAANRGIAPLVIEKTSKPAPLLSSTRNDIPPDINSLIARLLDRDPNQRPATADEAVNKLASFANTEALKPLAKQAIKTGEPGESSGPPYAIAAIQAQPTLAPPTKRTWIAAALATAALATVALVAGFIFYIKTDQGVLVVESEVDGVTVSIKQSDKTVDSIEVTQGENQTALRSGNYTIEFDAESDNVLVSESEVVVRRGEATVVKVRKQAELAIPAVIGDQELFKGKPLSHWVGIMNVERSLSTIRDAMLGIARLADKDDVDAAQTLLIAARRLGGWASDGGGGLSSASDDEAEYPSHRFMDIFDTSFRQLMPTPGIPAIARELEEGNARSRAACLLSLQNHSYHIDPHGFEAWAANEQNRPMAVELHNALRRLLRDGIEEPPGSADQTHSQDACRKLSLQIALALDRSVADEPGLKSILNEKLTKCTKPNAGLTRQEIFDYILTAKEPWSDLWEPYRVSANEVAAAKQLGIQFPIRVVVEATFARNQTNAQHVESIVNSARGADECLAWLGSSMQRAIGEISYQNPSWPGWLESVAKRTTRPEVAIRIFERLSNPEKITFGGSVPGAGFNHSGFHGTAPPKVREGASKAILIAEKRIFDDLESTDALPESVGDELRQLAKNLFAFSNGDPIDPNDPNYKRWALHPNTDWNSNGKVSEAEYAWQRQKEQWRIQQIPGAKSAQRGGEHFGGGGRF
jgi:serine/threonine protein kinase